MSQVWKTKLVRLWSTHRDRTQRCSKEGSLSGPCQWPQGTWFLQQDVWEEVTIKAKVLVALQFGLLGILFLKPTGVILVDFNHFAWISTGLYLGAVTIFAFAYIALRPSLRVSPIPKPGAPLITVGIYNWFRHPMYLGVLMFGLGMLINNLNLLSIAAFVALSVNMVIKANYEDRLLRARHSNAIEYQQRVLGLLGRKSA